MVTDEVALRETVLEMARVCGMTAHGVEDLVQACDLLGNISADVVFIPKMPVGVDWTAEFAYLRHVAPAVKVILASTYIADAWNDKSLFDGCLQKPFTIADLRRLVRALT